MAKSNQTLFEDLLPGFQDVLGGINKLKDANESYGKSAVAINEQIAKSQQKLKEELLAYKEQVLSLNAAHKKDQQELMGLKDLVTRTTTAYKEQTAAIKQNEAIAQNNIQIVSEMEKRLKALGDEYRKLDLTQKEDIKRKKEIERELIQTTKASDQLLKATQRATQTNNAAAGSYDALSKHLSEMRARLKSMPGAFNEATGELNEFNREAVELSKDIAKADKALKGMDATMGQFGRNVGNYPEKMGSFSSSIGGMVKGLFALEVVTQVGERIIEFGKDVFEITAKFEKYNAILKTTLGSTEAGAAAFAMIQEFAAKTNFGVDELTDSYIKLANRGLRPGQTELMKMADVANATGKPMGDLVEAINDINNTERWNEFGIKVKTNGDKVTMTFKGVTKEVERTEAGIMSAITAFGEMPGVMGMTAEISGTLDGQVSNLGDNFDRLKSTIGGDLKGVFSDIINVANILIETFIQVWQGTLPIREAFGLVVDTIGELIGDIFDLVKSMLFLREDSNKTIGIMDILTFVFKAVASSMIASITAIRMVVGAYDILLNKAKQLANFFGADFKIDTSATWDNLVKEAQKAAARIDQVWAGTSTTPTRPNSATPAPSLGGGGTGSSKPAPDKGKEMQQELDRNRDAVERKLKLLELQFEKGVISEQQYNERKHKIQVDGVNREIAILKKGGKEKEGEIRDANNRLLALEVERVKNDKQAAEKRLKDNIDKQKTATEKQLSELELAYKKGQMTEAEYIAGRAKIEQEGQHRIQKLLIAAGKQKSDEYAETEIKLNDIAAKYHEERYRLEGEAWKKTVDQAKEALKNVGDAQSDALESRIQDMEVQFAEEEKEININYARRKITEAQRNEQLHNARLRFLNQLTQSIESSYQDQTAAIYQDQTAAITKAYDDQIKRLEEWKNTHTLTVQQKADAEVEIERLKQEKLKKLEEEEKKRKKELADAKVEIAQEGTKKEEDDADAKKKVKDEKLEVEQQYFRMASDAVNGYFELVQAGREKELAQLEAQKQHELEIAGDNDEAKKAIEKRYEERQKQLRRKQAIDEKLQALFSIAVDTAQAIVASAEKPLLIPGIIALGAIQAGIVAARPIPAYRDGKNLGTLDRYEGPALAGEAGRELWFHNRGVNLLSSPTMIDVGKNDVILPNQLTEQLLSDNRAFEAQAVLHQVARQEADWRRVSEDKMRYQAQVMAMSQQGLPSAEAIGKSVADQLQKLPFDKIEFDERGFNRSIVEGSNRRLQQQKKHRLS
ncbi:hypothetical protein LX87_02288 [Larkinella arboricola]|uniref:Uncharacterized protein n=1 Tax=Larkinella arboricola TaxID=643671 RepID=A0A327X351_LARAB|nr:hypothetical protein [Larkinella arboricola]RAJ97388.1 hypothetical protein LX87_02288 [Larkinella arboricola]